MQYAVNEYAGSEGTYIRMGFTVDWISSPEPNLALRLRIVRASSLLHVKPVTPNIGSETCIAAEGVQT
jgi:hypothetical protein